MSEITIDTELMKNNGESIIKLVEELKTTYNELFNRIENVPVKTFEWVGAASEQYVAEVKGDKQEFMNFANELYKYGKYLIDSANEFEYTINKIKR